MSARVPFSCVAAVPLPPLPALRRSTQTRREKGIERTRQQANGTRLDCVGQRTNGRVQTTPLRFSSPPRRPFNCAAQTHCTPLDNPGITKLSSCVSCVTLVSVCACADAPRVRCVSARGPLAAVASRGPSWCVLSPRCSCVLCCCRLRVPLAHPSCGRAARCERRGPATGARRGQRVLGWQDCAGAFRSCSPPTSVRRERGGERSGRWSEYSSNDANAHRVCIDRHSSPLSSHLQP